MRQTIPFLATLTMLSTCVTASPRSSVPSQSQRPLATAVTVAGTDRFELRSDPRPALHHFLRAWALADAGEWPPYSPPLRELDAWEAELGADEIRAWRAAVEAYSRVRGGDLLFDEGLLAVGDWAAGIGDVAAIPADYRPLVEAIEAALPVYLAHWWPEHDQSNRRWIAAIEPKLDAIEEAVIPRLEAAYGGRWPTRRIPIDVMVHVNDVGAYSVRGRIAISGWNRNIQMPHALDLVFHEASHTEGLELPLRRAINDAFRAVDVSPPERLWHDVIFFTTGEVVRLVLEERGEPGYQPYAEATGVYARGERWAVELPALRRHWLPFLRSGSDVAAERRAALQALARALTSRPE